MSSQINDVELLKELAETNKKLKNEISKVIIGQDDVVTQLLITLFARGHCLLVGVPGLAKTLLIKSLCLFIRIPACRGCKFSSIALKDLTEKVGLKLAHALSASDKAITFIS